jgi:hypothetical protein
MKVSDVITNWPTKRWSRDDAPQTAFPPNDSEHLSLQWFGSPDDEGWFRIIATDSDQHDWSTFCRVEDRSKWPALEVALSGRLQASLAEVGMAEIAESAKSDSPTEG